MTSAETQELGLTEEPPPPPMRLRRRKLPVLTLCLALAAAAGAGFFAGVRVEKAQVKPTSSANNTPAAFAAALRQGAGANAGTTAGANSGGGTARNAGNGAPQAADGDAANGGAANGGAAKGGAADASGVANIVGTVAIVQGDTLYVTEASGDTVKVTTSDGTTVTKTVNGAVKDLAPGESVVVRGVQSSVGVYAAQTVTQGGATAGFGGFGGRALGQGRGAAGGGAQPTQSPKAGG